MSYIMPAILRIQKKRKKLRGRIMHAMLECYFIRFSSSLDSSLEIVQISPTHVRSISDLIWLFRNMMLKILYCPFNHPWTTLLQNWFGVNRLQLDVIPIFSVLRALLTTWLLTSLCSTATTMSRWYNSHFYLAQQLAFLNIFTSSIWLN